jgi:hypothetical protein
MVGGWDRLSDEDRHAWTRFIRGFQQDDGVFVDPVLTRSLARRRKTPKEILKRILRRGQPIDIDRCLLAESKQAFAALSDLGSQAEHLFQPLPSTPAAMRTRIFQENWRTPWNAGGQASGLCLLLGAQSTLRDPDQYQSLRGELADAFNTLLDPESGAYFKGTRPPQGQLVNGAMKVLTGLDWLDIPVHHPEKLIDLCLADEVQATGCHIADVVYVLRRCLADTDHRREEIAVYAAGLLGQVKRHAKPDGGFSFFEHRAQVSYYGAPVSKGANVGDLHGTFMLTWALALILDLVEDAPVTLTQIKP